MVRPLFIFGIARGGTNLLARAVAEHHQVVMALDVLMPLFKLWRNLAYNEGLSETVKRRFDPAAPFQDYYFNPDGRALLETLFLTDAKHAVSSSAMAELRDAIAARTALERPDRADSIKDLAGMTVKEVFAHLISIVKDWGKGEGKVDTAYVGFKEVWTIDFLPALARLFPSAKFIVIHRDPRAVVTSLLAMAKKDPSQAAHPVSYMRHWRKQVALAQQFAVDPAHKARLASVRFEDLCNRPQEELGRLCDFLSIEIEAAMFKPGGEWEGNSSFGPRRAAIDANAVDRWRATISPTLLDTIDFHCGREMRMVGYTPSVKESVLTAGVIETVRHFDANPGKWRSDFGDWESGVAWECMRHQSATAEWPSDVLARCFLIL